MRSFSNYTEKDETLSSKAKLKEEQLISTMEGIIGRHYEEKPDLKLAYDYYSCKRSREQYQYLEENFGIGSAVDVEFTPLVRIHVDYLVGEQLSNEDRPMISCKDSNTLINIKNDLEERLKLKEISELNEIWHKAVLDVISGQEAKVNKVDDIVKNIKLEKKKIKDNFKSRYEIAAQKILDVLIQSKEVDFKNKKKLLMQDLLITGSCYYRVSYEGYGSFPNIEVINPLDFFYRKDTNKTYVKDHHEAAWRKYMTTQEVINTWGHLMTDDQKDELQNMVGGIDGQHIKMVPTSGAENLTRYNYVMDSGYVTDEYKNQEGVHEVWFAEWVSNNKVENDIDQTVEGINAKPKKVGYRLDRYEGICINNSIYLNLGKSLNVQRSADAPHKCSLSVNGVSYSDRNAEPFSLVLKTKSLQDKYDVLHFYRDSLIANSGVKGGYVDVAQIPKFLGDSPEERLLKWKAYRKAGDALIDSSQDGRGMAPNTVYTGFDDTVSGQALQAIQLATDQTELIVSNITGVFREKLGGIEQRDAVSNVQVGLKQSSIITKPYFSMMQSVIDSLLSDALNMCRQTFKNGFVGSSILDDRSMEIITLNADDYVLTDYDVHIVDYSDLARDIEKLQAFSMEIAKSNSVDLDDLIKIITSKGLTEMKTELLQSTAEKKEENDQVKQLSEQLQQISEQLKKTNNELKNVQNENQKLKEIDREMEQDKINKEYEIKKEANKIKEKEVYADIEKNNKKLDVEKAQLLDNNPYNDKINI